MRRSVGYRSRLASGVTIMVLFLASAASAQFTAVGLYEYPETSNNTYGLTNTSSLAQGPDGNIYMSDQLDGQFGAGSAYNISPSGDFTTVYSFCAEGGACATTGALPFGGVTLGSNGNFYGTVQNGGTDGFGQVFQLTPDGVRTTIYNFTGANPGDGGAPDYPVFLASDGDLWGGESNSAPCGTLFRLTLKGKISNFPLDCNPNLPTEGSDGNFYGNAANGGNSGPCPGGCGLTEVEFGGVAATFNVVSGTELTAVVPAAAFTGVVSVVTSTGTLTAISNFKVLPTIKSISPTSGPVGTLVTITGTGVTGATSVTVDGKAASFTQVSSTEITVTVPATAKTGKITVTTAGGSASSKTFTVN
jgi:uncharacterized repeat protein (TIGR03803 family)